MSCHLFHARAKTLYGLAFASAAIATPVRAQMRPSTAPQPLVTIPSALNSASSAPAAVKSPPASTASVTAPAAHPPIHSQAPAQPGMTVQQVVVPPQPGIAPSAASSDTSLVQSQKDGALPLRSQKGVTLSIAAGHPAPSYVGGSLAFQLNPTLQIVGATGAFWSNELSIKAFSVSARFHVFDTDFTPMLGAGATYFAFSGMGKIQNLDTATVLGTLMIGLDWAFESGLRLGAGYTFHYPLSLNIPFVEIGLMF